MAGRTSAAAAPRKQTSRPAGWLYRCQHRARSNGVQGASNL